MNFLITGGSRGIGATMVRDAVVAGHDASFTYRTRADLAAEVVAECRRLAPHRRCQAYQLDVRDSNAVEAVGEQVLEDFGGIDAVVTNAAANHTDLAATTSDEAWREVIDTNLSGTFYVCRFFLPTFLAAGHGRFIHISSVAMGGMTGQAAYSASKAGLVGLSGTLGKEYGRKGITSNVLVLGFFDTDMTRQSLSDANRRCWSELCPVGRMGRPSEVAQTVLFLASEGAAFVNGQVIHVTGGMDWAL